MTDKKLTTSQNEAKREKTPLDDLPNSKVLKQLLQTNTLLVKKMKDIQQNEEKERQQFYNDLKMKRQILEKEKKEFDKQLKIGSGEKDIVIKEWKEKNDELKKKIENLQLQKEKELKELEKKKNNEISDLNDYIQYKKSKKNENGNKCIIL